VFAVVLQPPGHIRVPVTNAVRSCTLITVQATSLLSLASRSCTSATQVMQALQSTNYCSKHCAAHIMHFIC
jgi:hypothetical protein